MKIIFFGNADFGLETLNALIRSNEHDVVGIVTNPDTRISRSKKNKVNPIKKIGLDSSIPVLEQDDLSSKKFINRLKVLNADIFLVIAYKIISKSIYSIPKYGAVNLHASILPQYRGAAPIQRSIINGDKKTGLSTFFINDKVDRGELIYQEEVIIDDTDSFYDLWLRLSQKGPKVMLNTLDLIEKGETKIISIPKKPSYAPKINKKDLHIDWSENSLVIHNKIRAFSPYPCMITSYNQTKLKIISSRLANEFNFQTNILGSLAIYKSRLFVKCSDTFLEILKLKPESKTSMSAQDFINGFIHQIDSKNINVFK